jgi:hypothetical protein
LHGARHLETVTTVCFTASNFGTWRSSVCQFRTVERIPIYVRLGLKNGHL